ncbi:MAG TPA: DUF1223 domain-containing protein [Stellaceae bacterium]|nr:DUF1223 domain-containing protein [Stellaceae bacterium]
MRFRIVTACLLAGLATPAWAETRPVVVELFTSQGCSSCPPADALLDQLSHRDGVLALGYHIDYWDNLGWTDPFSSPEATARQRAYAARFDRGQIFTPQIVVDGKEDMVGNDRGAVLAALDTQPQAVAPVHFTADGSEVTIGAGTGRGTILLLRFARHRTTQIGAGENAHRTAEDTNAVLSIETRGEWTGSPRNFPIPALPAGEGYAVLVQAPDGRIVGAGSTVRTGPAPVRMKETSATSPHPAPKA